MNILEKIKGLFKRTKALPTPKKIKKSQNGDNSWIISNGGGSYLPNKLEENIDNFLKEYYNRISMYPDGQEINNYEEAYIALIDMNGKTIKEDEFDKNLYKENELLQQLELGNRYKVQIQPNKSGFGNDFYHVHSVNYKMPQDKDMIRVYLNCNNGNVAELAKALLDSNNNENFYLKFNASNPNFLKSRGEKIVIYCDNSDYEYTLNLIEYVKQLRPELFVESENVLPFMQNVNNIVSVARQPESNIYNSLSGNQKQIPVSVNAFLANMLEDSYMNVAREIARADSNLAFLLTEECFNDETLYMKNYPYINQNYREYLLKSMEAKMGVLSQRNGIYVDGINYQEINRRQKDREKEY